MLLPYRKWRCLGPTLRIVEKSWHSYSRHSYSISCQVFLDRLLHGRKYFCDICLSVFVDVYLRKECYPPCRPYPPAVAQFLDLNSSWDFDRPICPLPDMITSGRVMMSCYPRIPKLVSSRFLIKAKGWS